MSERVVMHSLTCSRMQEELAEARKGFSLAASRVAQPAGSGREGVGPRSGAASGREQPGSRSA